MLPKKYIEIEKSQLYFYWTGPASKIDRIFFGQKLTSIFHYFHASLSLHFKLVFHNKIKLKSLWKNREGFIQFLHGCVPRDNAIAKYLLDCIQYERKLGNPEASLSVL